MSDETTEPKCKTCKDTGRVLMKMEAIHAPPAPMMMIKVFWKCPNCDAVEAAPTPGGP